MITHKYMTGIRLMFPEPEDTGNGATEEVNDAPSEESQTDTDMNPFENLLSEEEEESTEPSTEQEDTDYSLALTEEEGFEADEISMLTSLSKKHNLPAETASAFLKDIYAEADKRGKEADAKAVDGATKALRDKWGNDFNANARKAGAMIKAIGGRLGWSADRMNGMLNAHDIELMHEVARYVGENKMRGLSNSAPVAPKPLSNEEKKQRMQSIFEEHYAARKAGDMELMKKLSDEHFALSKEVMGERARRFLV